MNYNKKNIKIFVNKYKILSAKVTLTDQLSCINLSLNYFVYNSKSYNVPSFQM